MALLELKSVKAGLTQVVHLDDGAGRKVLCEELGTCLNDLSEFPHVCRVYNDRYDIIEGTARRFRNSPLVSNSLTRLLSQVSLTDHSTVCIAGELTGKEDQ